MSAVVALRERQSRASAAKTLAVFADPVLGPDDPRMDAIVPQLASLPAAFQRSAFSGELARLQSSAYEAKTIAGLVAALVAPLVWGSTLSLALTMSGFLVLGGIAALLYRRSVLLPG